MVCSTQRIYVYDPDLEVFREASIFGGTREGHSFAEYQRHREERARLQQLEEQRIEADRQAQQRAAQRVELERPRVMRATDEFTQQLNITYRSGVRWDGGERPVPSLFTLALAPPSRAATIALRTSFASPHWAECHTFHLLADGQPAGVGEASHELVQRREGGRAFVVETVTASLAEDGVAALLAAQDVRGRICQDVFSLTPEAVLGLHGLQRDIATADQPAD